MAYDVVLERVQPRPLAAVHARVPVGQVGTAWRPALDNVWAFLREHEGLWTHGHNVFVYRHPRGPGESMEVDFGVEVSRPFTGDGNVVLTQTPGGEVASTVHVGRPHEIGRANAAIEAWCAANERSLAGVSWEVYGDPAPDGGAFEIRVFYLLR